MYFEATLAEKARKFFRLSFGLRAFPPNDITVEVTTRCARACAVCFRGPLGVQPGDMPAELFSKVISEIKAACGGGPRYLNFVGLGEPFCHPELENLLRLAARELPGTQLNLSTGLEPFDRAAFSRLAVDGILNRLSVSLDGPAADGAFHKFTGEARSNLEFVRDYKKNNPAFLLRVQVLLTSREAVEAAVRQAAAFGADEIQLMRVDLHAFGANPPAPRPGFAEERAIVAEAKALAASLGLACRNNNEHNFFMDVASGWDRYCLIADDHVFVTAEGDLIPCFYLRSEKFGNLGRQTLAEAARARKKAWPRRREGAGCLRCDIYKRRHHDSDSEDGGGQ
jgi:MoaA/NifB/PqqE/SkfB family radical SAM enzyme